MTVSAGSVAAPPPDATIPPPVRQRSTLGRRSLAVGRKLLQLFIVVVGVSIMTFALLNVLPGDPAVAALGDQATPQTIAAFRAEHGLDRPLVVRYWEWASHAATGDLGTSYYNGANVRDTIESRLPVSVELVLLAELIALALAIPAAVICTRFRGRWIDKLLSFTSFLTLAVPTFLLALIFILVLCVQLRLFPASGWEPLSAGLGANLRTAFLPALTLALPQYAVFMRLLRSDMVQTMGEDFVTTAYAKGASPKRILLRHVMRNSLFSLITVLGVNIGICLGGAVITETIFAVPGMGRLLIDSIGQRDIMVVQGVVLFLAVVYVLVNLLVDLVYALLDPRIRYGRDAE